MTRIEKMNELFERIKRNVDATHETMPHHYGRYGETTTNYLVSMLSLEDAENKMIKLICKSLKNDMKYYAEEKEDNETIIYINNSNNESIGKLIMISETREEALKIETTRELVKDDTFDGVGYSFETKQKVVESIKLYKTRLLRRY